MLEEVQYIIRDLSASEIAITKKEMNDTSFNSVPVGVTNLNLSELVDTSFNILDQYTDVSCISFTISSGITSKPHQFLDISFSRKNRHHVNQHNLTSD